jgi:hypothetical protein
MLLELLLRPIQLFFAFRLDSAMILKLAVLPNQVVHLPPPSLFSSVWLRPELDANLQDALRVLSACGPNNQRC